MIIAGGNCGPTLRDLTGAPSYSYHFNRHGKISGKADTEDEFWDDILSGEKMNYAMCAGTPGTDEGQLDSVGIVPGHAYTLLTAKEITDKDGNTVRIVQMRNPWKQGEWTGRFSDKSDDWTEELKKECGVKDEDDGLFWMPFDNMMEVFDVVDICKYDDKAKYSFTQVTQSGDFALIPFKIKKGTTSLITFAVSQRGCRTEEAEGNHEFNQNCYARKVKVGIAKLTNYMPNFKS